MLALRSVEEESLSSLLPLWCAKTLGHKLRAVIIPLSLPTSASCIEGMERREDQVIDE